MQIVKCYCTISQIGTRNFHKTGLFSQQNANMFLREILKYKFQMSYGKFSCKKMRVETLLHREYLIDLIHNTRSFLNIYNLRTKTLKSSSLRLHHQFTIIIDKEYSWCVSNKIRVKLNAQIVAYARSNEYIEYIHKLLN